MKKLSSGNTTTSSLIFSSPTTSWRATFSSAAAVPPFLGSSPSVAKIHTAISKIQQQQEFLLGTQFEKHTDRSSQCFK